MGEPVIDSTPLFDLRVVARTLKRIKDVIEQG
jgi:hypothetical protein